MTIAELLTLKPDTTITVLNKPFHYIGTCTVSLDGDGTRAWLFEEDGAMLAVSPQDEEILFFEKVDEELEPQGGMILYRSKEFEFSYEDAGTVTKLTGDAEGEQDDRYGFSDYETDGGEVIRLVANENTGDARSYFGVVVGEEDIVQAA